MAVRPVGGLSLCVCVCVCWFYYVTIIIIVIQQWDIHRWWEGQWGAPPWSWDTLKELASSLVETNHSTKLVATCFSGVIELACWAWPDINNITNSLLWCLYTSGVVYIAEYRLATLTLGTLTVVMLYIYTAKVRCTSMEPIHASLSCLSQSSLSPHLESPSLVSPSEYATRE